MPPVGPAPTVAVVEEKAELGMRFGILGPLEVWHDGERLTIGGPQQRALLAVLLLNANSVVSADRLVDHLWGERPPDSARHLLKGCIAGLRRALRVGRTERLLTRPPGYLLEVLPGEFDLDRFDELAVAAGKLVGTPTELATVLRGALSCWRGPALDGLDLDVCRAEAARLDERRLAVLEERIDVDLRLGSYPDLVAELQALVRQHPLRERLWAQLMLALHGANRQTDALAVYRQVRQLLVEELGVEPSVTLRQAQRVVLTGARIDTAKPGTLVVPNGKAPQRSVVRSRADDPPIPAQLPADVANFTGRGAELSELSRLHPADAPTSTEMLIIAVSGTAGVGKTALAIRWTHSVRGRFPDGQLYVNLRGYDPGQPVTAATALGRFLTGLGLPDRDIPGDLDSRAARFRTEVAGRRMLIMLDNASSVDQIRPLLPGTSSCVVVVTSRAALAGLVALHGAHRLNLDLLPTVDAIALLGRLIGDRVEAEPLAAAALAEQCARLPLALRVAAELAAARPASRLAELVGELGDQRRRLDLLEASGDPMAAVRTGFSWSYRRLPADAARTFRLAGLYTGPEFDAHAMSAQANTSIGEARRTLDLLASEHLIQGTAHGRYVMHALLRAYAAGEAASD
jgi:DNA-binding SARP family transcriptional activator